MDNGHECEHTAYYFSATGRTKFIADDMGRGPLLLVHIWLLCDVLSELIRALQHFTEFLGAVPSLRHLNNGLAFDARLGLTLLLDKDNWVDGAWDGGLEMELVALVSFFFVCCICR